MFGLATFRSYIAHTVAQAGTDLGFSEDLEPYAQSFSGLMNQTLAYSKMHGHRELNIHHPFGEFFAGRFLSADHWLLVHCRYVQTLLRKLVDATEDDYYAHLEGGVRCIIQDIEKSGEVPVSDNGAYQRITEDQRDVLLARIDESNYSDVVKSQLAQTVRGVFEMLSQPPYRDRPTSVELMWHILPPKLPDELLILGEVATRYSDIALALDDTFYDWQAVLSKDPDTETITVSELSVVAEAIPTTDRLQQKTYELCTAAFGEEMATGLNERTQRFAEEALELLQACDVPKSMILNAVEYVYNREKGEPSQEVGGVHTTLLALCNALGVSLQDAAIDDLSAFEKNAQRIAEKRKRKPDFYSDFGGEIPTLKPVV